MSGPDAVGDVAGALQRVRRPHPVRVAVTGRDAAGKTTFADAIARVLRGRGRQVVRASIDDFHRRGHRDRAAAGGYTPAEYYRRAFDFEALRDGLLVPIAAGSPRCVVGTWDAFRDCAHEQWAAVEPDAVAIVDGVFLLRPELRRHWDFTIWLEIDAESSVARGLQRDVAWIGSPDEIVRRYRTRNIPAHELFVADSGGADTADAVVDNHDPAAPRLLRLEEPAG